MKIIDLEDGLFIDGSTPFFTSLKKKQDEKADEDPGVDYAAEYKKQTGRDLETGEYVTQ